MAPSAALTSDHVNYLILRYLQEAGHTSTATAFYRDWRRNAEFSDPEDYPFATQVHNNELVKIIQSGLQLDELQARVLKDQRRFKFTLANSTEADGGLENGATATSASGSRPSSSAKRKGRAAALRARDDFPTPAAKRQRRSEEIQVNGDSMDVDAPASATAGTPAADAEEDGDAVSPAVGSEPEMTEVHERYDSMDVAVQTETKTGPRTSTMYWKVEKPKATIYHSVFNPSPHPPTSPLGRPHTLMAVGEFLCRFYQVPENMDNTTQVLSIDEPTLLPNSVVTASAWHPNGQVAAFAADTVRELLDGKQTSQQSIFSHDSNTGKHLHYLSPPLLDPQGIVLALRYNHSGDRLIALRTNLKHGLVLVYNTSEEGTGDRAMPIAWITYDQHILDAAWVTPTDFVVVGERGLAQLAHLEHQNDPDMGGNLTAADMKSFGIACTDIDLLNSATDAEGKCSYDKVRVGMTRSGITPILIASTDMSRLAIVQTESSRLVSSKPPIESPIPVLMTAAAFQPIPTASNEETFALFALTYHDGRCVLYSYAVTQPDDNDNSEQNRLQDLCALKMNHGPALALAWSPNGSYLAVAGTDLVHIWEVGALITKKGPQLEVKTDAQQNALVTWRPDATALGRRNGDHEDAKTLSEPSLSWSANGQNLAFAVDREVAVIRFTPPLGSIEEKEGVNGHLSP